MFQRSSRQQTSKDVQYYSTTTGGGGQQVPAIGNFLVHGQESALEAWAEILGKPSLQVARRRD